MMRPALRFALVAVIASLHASCLTAASPGERALRQGDNATAVRLFDQALALNPDDHAAMVGLGVASYRLRAFADAIETLEGATNLDPRDPTARIFLGLAYMRQGALERAGDELSAYRRFAREPSGAAQVDQALRALAAEPNNEQRARIADSLESLAENERTRH